MIYLSTGFLYARLRRVPGKAARSTDTEIVEYST